MKFFLGLITRCKDEFFIEEFVKYYLSQGVDKIYIVDDNSNNKNIYNFTKKNKKIIIEYMNDKNTKAHDGKCKKNCSCNRIVSNKIFNKIKNNFKWLIYVDVDEFITTKKNKKNTIRKELMTTFKNYDCIKIPWVMMSCNNLIKNPKSILKTNVYRWNHNKKHPHKIKKFRCRYNNIETKCIFIANKFKDIMNDHTPTKYDDLKYNIVDSINGKNKYKNDNIFYKELREYDIKNGYFLCYHYRIISRENCLHKIKVNNWYKINNYTIEDIMSSDYPEIIDDTMKLKSSID